MSSIDAPTLQHNTESYILGRTTDEYERLRQQSRVLEPITRTVLERAGLTRGMSCLDVGCGPGEVMRLMAEYAGPEGRVTGVDVDGNIGREALARLHAAGLQQCTFLESDLQSLEQRTSEKFDFVFSRLLLMHAGDPAKALAAMRGRLKSGGVIVAQDYYCGSINAYPPHAGVDELKRTFYGVCEKTGKDPEIGLAIPEHFVRSGIGVPDGTDVSGILRTAAESAQMLMAVYRAVLPRALESGVTTEQRTAWFFNEMKKVESEGGYVLWPLLVSAWKKL